MKMKINIINGNDYLIDSINWAIEKDFSELTKIGIPFNKTSAADIMKMNNISDYSKILLSAVAGAVIQHVIDCHPDMMYNFDDMYMLFE
jgi:hypothetical protein